MKKKKIITTVLAVTLVLSSAFSSLAGQWMQDGIGWWWQEDYGWYPTSEWMLINGKEYYFGADGYMLHDTVQDGFVLDSSGARVIPDLGLEEAPYKAELDIMIANNYDDYNDFAGFGLDLLNYDVGVNWIDCGYYYKVENVKLWHDDDYITKDIGVLSEVRFRKDGRYLYNEGNQGYLTMITLDEWIEKGKGLPDIGVIFDDKGYVIGFRERIAG